MKSPESLPSLLLHICCGPCATSVIERLSDSYAITGYYYNPNVHPEEEYRRRIDAASTVAGNCGVNLIEGLPDPNTFFEAVKGLEEAPENGERCTICYRFRLAKTADTARDLSFDAFATTLTLGPQKKAEVINPIGINEAERAGVEFIDGDWKKKDGFKRSCELSHELGIYRQHFCGCAFSMRDDDSE